MINKVLASQLWKVRLAYLDDIIVLSQKMNSHLHNLRRIFVTLSEAGLRLQPKKCPIAASSILYLGHVVDSRSVKPGPAANSACPRNVKEVICNYYQRFVKKFPRIYWPLNDLTKADVVWSWNLECQSPFDKLKQHLTRKPKLRLSDPSLHLEVHMVTESEQLWCRGIA